MARSGKTAQEFIQSSFSPIVAVLCSPKVENVVSKNNLSFTELLQPFTSMDWEGQFREPGGSVCLIKNWKLIIRDVNWKPLQPTEARRQLNNAVLHNYNDKTVCLELEGRKFEMPHSTPWFDAWRETYLEVQFPSDHEYTKHFLSCVIVATTHDDNIVDTYNTLNQQYAQLQNVTPPKLPKWFNNEILKSYLLLHDVSSVSKEKADTSFETLKQTFGASNCFMLCINSKSTMDPCLPTDYWTPYIKRSFENNMDIMTSSQISTPVEPQATFPPTTLKVDENQPIGSTNPEGLHPLTSTENDMYDNANSLQTHSFSGSSESVSVSGKLLDYSTEIHGAALNASDVDAVKKFLQEYASKALLPHLEKQIALLSEGVTTRKGVSRSLISATKRWFNTGKGGNTTVNNTVIYSSDCPELQLRRLGDLWFMCGQWQRAFETYHTAKREFNADSAWLCYAGALEMAALSAFMAGEASRKTHGYMEESIVTYLNTCRMVQYAVRATLLSVLCLSSAGFHGEAAKQLIRMTSEDSDLRSAMLLEQAALCFLSGPGSKAMCRKYAFHMVLAGHRFSKSGQKKHAYRCYKQAYQVYLESGWRLALDHVQFALGRLAGALRVPRDAVRWLQRPLAPLSPQPPHQQAAFLNEYMIAHQQWIESSDEYKEQLPPLPIPLLLSDGVAVLCVGPAPLSSPGRAPATSLSLHDDVQAQPPPHYWAKMEEMLLQVVHGTVPMIFKPTVDLYTEKTDSNPVVPQGEPIQISITLSNPLKICLLLKDVELLWQFVTSAEDAEAPNSVLNNEPSVAAGVTLESNFICGQKIKTVLLEGESKKILTFTLTPLRVGQLNIQGLAYKLNNAGESGSETGNVTISGKIDLLSGLNNTDKRLQILVIPHAPCLQMTFSETSVEVISGEMRMVDVEFRNVGPVDMCDLHIAVSHPDCISLVTADDQNDFKALYDEKYLEPPVYSDERAARLAAARVVCARHVRSCAGAGAGAGAARLGRGAAARATLLLRPRALPALALLAYYRSDNTATATTTARPYRLLRHVFRFTVTEAVEVTVTPRRSLRSVDGSVAELINIATEVKNLYSEKDEDVILEILEAHLLSRQWKLTELTAARNSEDPLLPHERAHLIFKARRILEPLPEGKIEASRVKVNKIPDNVGDTTIPHYSKFVVEYKPSYLDTVDPYVQEKVSSGLIQSMLILRWKVTNKTKGKTAIGQHCLWMDCFKKVESRETELSPIEAPALQLDDYDTKIDVSDAKKKNKDNVVMFRLEHSNYIKHDFNLRKLCLVPVTINIVNCYGFPVQVFIDMSKQQSRESPACIGWAGALSTASAVGAVGAETGRELGVSVRLEGQAARRVQLRGVCAAPGTYLLGAAFAVSARRDPPPSPPAAGHTPAAARAAAAHTPAPPLRALARPHTDTSLLVVQAA